MCRSLVSFARRFCTTSVVNESPGRRPLNADQNVHTVDGGTGAFSLHPELSREPWKPDAAFFACMSPPSAGGATTICDGGRAGARDARRGAARAGAAAAGLYQGDLARAARLLARHRQPQRRAAARAAALLPVSVPPPGRADRAAVHAAGAAPARCSWTRRRSATSCCFARFNNRRNDFPLLDDLTPGAGRLDARDQGRRRDRISVPVRGRRATC
jgi:hypothetical protein